MGLLEAEVSEVGEGWCVIEVPYSEKLTQQQRYLHGALAGAIGDSAGGYAALTLAPEGREVLAVEYKINFLAPVWGHKMVARGEVLRPVGGCSYVRLKWSPSLARERRPPAQRCSRP